MLRRDVLQLAQMSAREEYDNIGIIIKRNRELKRDAKEEVLLLK